MRTRSDGLIHPGLMDLFGPGRRPAAFAAACAAIALALLALDLTFLGVVARPLYDRALGPLKREPALWPAAALFYAMYVGAVAWSAAGLPSWRAAARRGAALGFFAYATYELTNWAVLRGWPAMLVPIDLAWGVVLTAVAAVAGQRAFTGVLRAQPDAEVRALVARLDLAPHPEGGFYRETFRSPERLQTARGERAALTVIHYLLPAGALSAFHRVLADEAWHHAGGSPVELHVLAVDGAYHVHHLGPASDPHAASHVVVPAGAWQAARPLGGWGLASCSVSPGFEFEDFVLARPQELAALRPDLAAILAPLCSGAGG